MVKGKDRIMGEISIKIMELRKSNNMSQEQLAEQLYVSRQAVSKWERGEALPDINNLAAIAKLFNVTIDSIVNGDVGRVEVVIQENQQSQSVKRQLTLEEKDIKNRAVVMLIIAIGLIIASPVVLIMNNGLGSFSFIIFFGLIICGVGLIIYSSHLKKQVSDYDEIDKKEEETGIIAKVSSVTSSLAVIVFLLLGFVWGLWHPGWLVFLLTPLIVGIMKIFKKDETE